MAEDRSLQPAAAHASRLAQSAQLPRPPSTARPSFSTFVYRDSDGPRPATFIGFLRGPRHNTYFLDNNHNVKVEVLTGHEPIRRQEIILEIFRDRVCAAGGIVPFLYSTYVEVHMISIRSAALAEHNAEPPLDGEQQHPVMPAEYVEEHLPRPSTIQAGVCKSAGNAVTDAPTFASFEQASRRAADELDDKSEIFRLVTAILHESLEKKDGSPHPDSDCGLLSSVQRQCEAAKTLFHAGKPFHAHLPSHAAVLSVRYSNLTGGLNEVVGGILAELDVAYLASRPRTASCTAADNNQPLDHIVDRIARLEAQLAAQSTRTSALSDTITMQAANAKGLTQDVDGMLVIMQEVNETLDASQHQWKRTTRRVNKLVAESRSARATALASPRDGLPHQVASFSTPRGAQRDRSDSQAEDCDQERGDAGREGHGRIEDTCANRVPSKPPAAEETQGPAKRKAEVDKIPSRGAPSKKVREN